MCYEWVCSICWKKFRYIQTHSSTVGGVGVGVRRCALNGRVPYVGRSSLTKLAHSSTVGCGRGSVCTDVLSMTRMVVFHTLEEIPSPSSSHFCVELFVEELYQPVVREFCKTHGISVCCRLRSNIHRIPISIESNSLAIITIVFNVVFTSQIYQTF